MNLDLTGVNELLISGIAAVIPTAVMLRLAEWTIRTMLGFVFNKKTNLVD